MPQRFALALCALGLLLAACDGGGTDPIDATGTVKGVAYIDRNGDGQLNADLDGPARGVRVSLAQVAGGPATNSAVTNQLGEYLIAGVPVGSYRVTVDPASLGDTLRVARVDSATLTVTAARETGTLIALEVVPLTIAQARTTPVGRLVTLEAVTLNSGNSFSDSTVHLGSASGAAIRMLSFASAQLAAGDSVRVQARLTVRDGQPALEGATVFLRGKAAARTPVDLSTAAAATADGRQRDAALVRIRNASILDTATTTRGLWLTVDDGSGPVRVLRDRASNITTPLALIPGAVVEVTGVLAPTDTAGWYLRPRTSDDVKVRYPSLPISQARRRISSQVIVEGVALTGWGTFGDSSFHVADSSGAAIRVVRVPPPVNVTAGDSVRVIGLVLLRDDQPALTNASVTRLGTANQAITPVRVGAGVAGRARDGALDAALVRIDSAVITNSVSTTPAGDGLFTIKDDTGQLDVLLDQHTAFGLDKLLAPGALIFLRGVLVPVGDGSGRWRLKPRGTPDLRVEYPLYRIDQARQQPASTAMTIEGVALNGWHTFGDATIHVADATGTLRVVRVPGIQVSQGDSVRFVGLLAATTTGQVVLDASERLQPTLLGRAQRMPTPVTVTPAEAASARSGQSGVGQLDGALVRLENAVVRDTASTQGGDFVLKIGEPAAEVSVVLDASSGLATTVYAPGTRLSVVGLLVPSATPRVWVVKPRTREDIDVQ